MKIGIISAMNQEIKSFFKILDRYIEKKNQKHPIYIGKYKNLNIILIISGIGKVSASIASMILIHQYDIQLIINCGSAGSLKTFLKIGDIIIPNKICYYDVNLTSFGYYNGQIPHYPRYFQINENLYKVLKKIHKNYQLNIFEGLLISGDSFVSDDVSIKKLNNNFSTAIAVDMESAAICQVCYKFKIPFIIIKSISDLSNQTAKQTFTKNISNISFKYIFLIKKILKHLINIKKISNLINKT